MLIENVTVIHTQWQPIILSHLLIPLPLKSVMDNNIRDSLFVTMAGLAPWGRSISLPGEQQDVSSGESGSAVGMHCFIGGLER